MDTILVLAAGVAVAVISYGVLTALAALSARVRNHDKQEPTDAE